MITDKSLRIQQQELQNKKLMEQKFASVRKQVREVRQSQKVVNQYYKSMMKANYHLYGFRQQNKFFSFFYKVSERKSDINIK